MTETEIAAHARFDQIRYAQVWEDADILVEALAPQATDTVVSIASAGDNAFALLATGCARVVAVDLNPAQLACVRLREQAYRKLSYAEFLELMGSRASYRRKALLERSVEALSETDRALWMKRRDDVVAHGVGGVGKFERYFRLFRTRILPFVHGRATIASLLRQKTAEERRRFYDQHWNTLRWRMMLKAFFSKPVMGRLGRDPAFFEHARGSLSDQVAELARRALVEQDPSRNPYLHWILTGRHGEALPRALREEHFTQIRDRLDALEVRLCTIESLVGSGLQADAFNLSDIFEYMSPAAHRDAYAAVLEIANPGARVVYWNMMVPRRAPGSLAARVARQRDIETALAPLDKAFFYRDFIVEKAL